MNKTILFAAAVILFTSCNNPDKTENDNTVTTVSDTAAMTTETRTMPADTMMRDTPVNNVSTTSATSTTKTAAYSPSEGDITYRNGKLMVWRNNKYVESDKDVTLGEGLVAKRNGEITKDGEVVSLDEGESVSKTGRFFNKAGEGIEHAWDATKKGVSKAAGAVKKAGKKVGEAGKKVGEEVKDAVQ